MSDEQNIELREKLKMSAERLLRSLDANAPPTLIASEVALLVWRTELLCGKEVLEERISFIRIQGEKGLCLECGKEKTADPLLCEDCIKKEEEARRSLKIHDFESRKSPDKKKPN